MSKFYRLRSGKLNLLVGMLMIAQAVFFAVPASALSGSTIAALTNQQRAVAGLPALAWNGALSTSAALKAQDMCAKNYWAHTSPDGLTPWTFMTRAGYSYVNAGENLAKGYSTDSGVISGWMASPTHRANVLNTQFTETGVAVTTCTLLGSTSTLVVAHYGSRYQAPAPTQRAAQPAAQPAPKPVARTTTAPKAAPVAAQPAVAQAAPVAVVASIPKPEELKKLKITPDIIKYAQLCSYQNRDAFITAMKLLGVDRPCQ